MKTKNINLLVKDIENIAFAINAFFNNRDENDVKIIKNEILILEEEIKNLNLTKNKLDRTKLKFLKEISEKLRFIADNLEKIVNKDSLTSLINLNKMTEIILEDINEYIFTNKENTDVFLTKLKRDFNILKAYEESNKRILLTYVIENPSYMKEVLSLIKIGETYIHIMENLLSTVKCSMEIYNWWKLFQRQIEELESSLIIF